MAVPGDVIHLGRQLILPFWSDGIGVQCPFGVDISLEFTGVSRVEVYRREHDSRRLVRVALDSQYGVRFEIAIASRGSRM